MLSPVIYLYPMSGKKGPERQNGKTMSVPNEYKHSCKPVPNERGGGAGK